MKRRLREWVKITLTIVLTLIAVLVYSFTGIAGELAQTSNWYDLLCLILWSYLFVGTPFLLSLLWED